MKLAKRLVLSGLLSILAGCGGGGSGGTSSGGATPVGDVAPNEPGDTSSPTPAEPSPTPTEPMPAPAEPTPQPAAPPAASVPTLRQAIARGGFASPTLSTFGGNRGTVAIGTDLSRRITTTGGINRTYRTPEATLLGLEAFTTSDESDFLLMTAPGSGIGSGSIGGFSLTYTTFGFWLESDVSFILEREAPRFTDAGAFFAGVQTPTERMPGDGIARYRGAAVAGEATGGVGRALLAGQLEATADFSRNTLSASTTLQDTDDFSRWGTVTMKLPIAGNSFNGGTATSNRGHSGSVDGQFMGPNADEIGGMFRMTGPSTVHGSFAASR